MWILPSVPELTSSRASVLRPPGTSARSTRILLYSVPCIARELLTFPHVSQRPAEEAGYDADFEDQRSLAVTAVKIIFPATNLLLCIICGNLIALLISLSCDEFTAFHSTRIFIRGIIPPCTTMTSNLMSWSWHQLQPPHVMFLSCVCQIMWESYGVPVKS